MKRRTKIAIALAIPIAGLILLVAGAWVAGSLLDERHSVTRTLTVEHPPAAVWKLIANPADSARWRPTVRSVSQDGETFREVTEMGEIRYRIEARDEERRLVTRIVETEDFGGTWTSVIEPAAKGCTISITEDGEVYNPIMRVFSAWVFGHESSIEGYLAALEAELAQS